MFKLPKLIKKFVIFSIVFSLFFIIWTKITEPNIEKLSTKINSGDILFQTLKTPVSIPIVIATRSLLSHTAIAVKEPDGTVSVIEARGPSPVAKIPLKEWIGYGLGKRIVIKRLQGITAERSAKVIEAAEKYLGLGYDKFYFFDRDKIYCSELVYYAFKDSIDRPVGRIQTLSELKLDNRSVQNMFKAKWKNHPACKSEDGEDNITFYTCYNLMIKQSLMTPVSQYKDVNLTTIYDNY